MNNKTLTLLIGNSDNKLTQKEWNRFCENLSVFAHDIASEVHFEGFSPSNSQWQNAAIVLIPGVDIEESNVIRGLKSLCVKFKQESIAVIVGETKFIKP